ARARPPAFVLPGTSDLSDRERAERIGADAIVSKPFDSQQLLSQVEALLARASKDAASSATTVVVPMSSLAGEPAPPGPPPLPIRPATEPIAKPAAESPPFEAGSTAEDFTGTIRLPAAASSDPFEEEYGRAGVDSAIEAFEKSQSAFSFGSAESEIEIDDERLTGKTVAAPSTAVTAE